MHVWTRKHNHSMSSRICSHSWTKFIRISLDELNSPSRFVDSRRCVFLRQSLPWSPPPPLYQPGPPIKCCYLLWPVYLIRWYLWAGQLRAGRYRLTDTSRCRRAARGLCHWSQCRVPQSNRRTPSGTDDSEARGTAGSHHPWYRYLFRYKWARYSRLSGLTQSRRSMGYLAVSTSA